jgi:serine/threonine-protein kinase
MTAMTAGASGERGEVIEDAETLIAGAARAAMPGDSAHFLPRAHRLDRYEILGFLGAGGMGAVYRVRDGELGEDVALKLLRADLTREPDALERFRDEVRLARRVTHRNVARTYDIGEHQGQRFLTMELVDGRSLASLLAERGALPAGEVVAVAVEICAGLAAAHRVGVVHHDLKPENVMVARDGRIIITDFGIARMHRPGTGGPEMLAGRHPRLHGAGAVRAGCTGRSPRRPLRPRCSAVRAAHRAPRLRRRRVHRRDRALRRAAARPAPAPALDPAGARAGRAALPRT